MEEKNKQSQGLGDTIEKITTATGVSALAKKIPGECGCKKRKEWLNRHFPYTRKKK